MKKNAIILLTVVVVAVMLITAAPVASTNIAIADGGYKKSQAAASQANDCGNGIFLFSVLCQNLESQIQGDGNAVNIIGLQTGGGELELSKWLSDIDEQQLLSAFEWLKANGFDKEWLQDIDEQQFLSAFEWLKANGFDKELLSGGSDTANTAGYGGGFILILVLFILLVIIGAGFGSG